MLATSVFADFQSIPLEMAAFIRVSILRMGGDLRGVEVSEVVGDPLPSDEPNIGHSGGSVKRFQISVANVWDKVIL